MHSEVDQCSVSSQYFIPLNLEFSINHALVLTEHVLLTYQIDYFLGYA